MKFILIKPEACLDFFEWVVQFFFFVLLKKISVVTFNNTHQKAIEIDSIIKIVFNYSVNKSMLVLD